MLPVIAPRMRLPTRALSISRANYHLLEGSRAQDKNLVSEMRKQARNTGLKRARLISDPEHSGRIDVCDDTQLRIVI